MTRKTEDTLISAAKGVLEGNYYSYAALAAAVAAAEEEAWADYQSKNFWPLQARQINLTKNQTNPKTQKMKITIRHDQNSIDPSATISDDQFPNVLAALETQYREAILAEYPDADITFEGSSDTNSIVVKTSGLDDPSDIEENIQRITETVYGAGLFWESRNTFWIAALYEGNGLALDCPDDAAWGYENEEEWIDAVAGSALFKTQAAAEKAAKKSLQAFGNPRMYYTLTEVSRDEAKAEFEDAEI